MTEPEPDQPPEPARPPEAVRVRLRRAPRYRAFVVAGAVVGAVAGIVVSLLLGDPSSLIPERATTAYLAAIGLLLGCLLGGAVAVLADRPRR